MDITSFERSDTTEIEIRDPLGNPTDIKVEVYGRDSKAYRKAVMEIAREPATDDESEMDRRGARVVLAGVKSWENVTADGQEISPDSEEAINLLAREDVDWFADQINRAINNRANFFSRRGSD